MSAPDKSNLDGMQVLSHSFDDATGEIRVQASVTANISQTEVIIDAANDSIKIGDGTDFLAINPDGSINVNATISGIVAVTQSGTWNINNITGTVSLPTGASTSANQTNGNQKTQIVDGSGNVIGSTSNALDVNIKSSAITLEVNLDNANDDVLIYGNDGGTNRVVKTDSAGTVSINDGGNSVTVDSVDLDIRDLAFATDKVDVTGSTIAATQSGTWNIGTVTTITNVVHVDDNGGSLTVDGTVTANQGGAPWSVNTTQLDGNAISLGSGASAAGTQRVILATDQPVIPVSDNGGSLTVDGSVTVTQATGTNLHTVIDSGTITTITNVVHVDDNGGSLTVDNPTLSVVGGGAEATALRVTIANDSTGVLSIDDNGGSITVDGTVAATQSGTWNINNITGTISLPTGASTLAEQQTQTTSLQLIDDAVYTDGVGTPSKGIAVMGTDGTNPHIISTNSTGHVNIADGGNSITVDGSVTVTQATAANLNATVVGTGTFAVQATVAAGATNIAKAEDVASADADVGVPAMAIRKATPANTSGTDGDYEMLQMSAGRLWTSTTVESIIPGTSATSLGKAEDAGHTTGDTGVMALAVRNDANTALAGTTGDYIPITTDSLGNLWVKSKLVDSTNADLDLTTGGQTGVKVMVVGDDDKFVRGAQADNTSQVGGPVVTGGFASSSPPSDATEGFIRNHWVDLVGRHHITGDTGMFPLSIDGAGQTTDISVNVANSITATVSGTVSADTELASAVVYSDSLAAANTTAPVVSLGQIFNGTTLDRIRSITNSTNSTGTGIQAVGILAQYDDVATSAVSENQFANLRMSSARGLHTMPVNASGTQLFSTPASTADITVNPTTTTIAAFGHTFSGTTWDRERTACIDVTILTSAARTTTQTSADQINYNGSALIVVLDMTTVGTGSVTLTVDGKDSVSGKYYNILTGAAVVTNSTNVYRIGRDLAAVANATVLDYLPRTFRIVVTANNANSATYSVGYSLVK